VIVIGPSDLTFSVGWQPTLAQVTSMVIAEILVATMSSASFARIAEADPQVAVSFGRHMRHAFIPVTSAAVRARAPRPWWATTGQFESW
jgi:hypothetical protein